MGPAQVRIRKNAAMSLLDRILVRALRARLPEGSKILAMEHGTSDALGEERKVTAVLTDLALLLATTVRTRTVLTTVPRREISLIEVLDVNYVAINYDDYTRAIRRVIKLDLRRRGDRAGLLAQLGAGGGTRASGAMPGPVQ